jgi:hypothetical protein
LYSFFQVGYRTINVLPFIVLIYLFYRNKNKFQWNSLDIKAILPVFYIFPITYLIYGCYSLPISIENDVRHYSKIAYSLGVFKQENFYHFYNAYNSNFNGIMPYHYIEMWLTSIINIFFHIKSIIAIKYVSYPFFVSCISFGVLGFVNTKRFFFFLLFLFLSSFPLYFISVFKSGWEVYTDFWLRPNFLIYYYSLVVLFYLIVEKKWVLLFLLGIIISSTSIIIIPCLFGGLFMLSVWLTSKNEICLKEMIKLNLLLFISFLFMLFMDIVFSPSVNINMNHPFLVLLISSIKLWKAVIHTITTLMIECGFLILLGYLINRVFIKENKFYFIYIFVFFQCVIGVCLFQMLNQLDNSYQFPYFAFASSGFMLILSFLLLVHSLKNKFAMFALGISTMFLCFYLLKPRLDFILLEKDIAWTNLIKNQVDDKWILQVSNYLKSHPEAKGGFVVSKNDLQDFPPKSRNCVTFQMGSFLAYLTDNCNLPDITCKDTLLSDKNETNKKEFEKAETWMAAFPDFIQECDPLQYLVNSKLNYFVCTSKNFRSNTNNIAVIENEKSKYIFVIRK